MTLRKGSMISMSSSWDISRITRPFMDQARPVSHIVRENYVQDSFTNVLGRNIVFSISWNFGKMNAARSNSARRAMANLMVQ